MVQAKVCGLTRREDALWAAECGAAALGFILVPGSKRQADPDLVASLAAVVPPFCWRIGVCVDQPVDEVLTLARRARLDAVQLHGDETTAVVAAIAAFVPVIRAVRADQEDAAALMREQAPHVRAFLIDSGAGLGRTFSWEILRNLPSLRPLIVAGGLEAANLPDLLRLVRPAAVDASSRLEISAGIKDMAKVQAFVQAAMTAAS